MTQPLTAAPSFQVRPAEPGDIRAIAELWHDAFPGKRTVAQRIRTLESAGPFGGLETVVVAAEPDGGVAGACKIYSMTEYIAGVPMPMMGLAAVAVSPARRRRGLGARLCVEAMDRAADRGEVISVLYPFRPGYYERLGWGLVGALHEFRFYTRALEPRGDARHVRSADMERDAGAMAACYGRVAARSNGPVERDRQVWTHRFAGGDLGVEPVDAGTVWTEGADPSLRAVVHDDGSVSGYALFRYVTKGSPEDNTLEVRELVAETDAAYGALLAHIAEQHDQWPRCHYFARPDERFGDFLRDPRPPRFRGARSLYFPTARIVRGPMLRVVDVPGALGARRYFAAGGSGDATLVLSVVDEQRPANAGPWTIRLEAGAATVEAGEAGTADVNVETDVATLSRIFAGEIQPTTAAVQGRARVAGDVALLDRAFATREGFWLLDEF